MPAFNYKNDLLHIEQIPFTKIAAEFGSPVYVYSARKIKEYFAAYANNMPLDGLVCYAVKANSNLAILQLLAQMGAGFDIVSGGELARVLKAGGDPQKIVFSGVGKTAVEMQAALQAGIYCFNLESSAEAHLLNQVAKSLNLIAPISLRVNPDIDAGSHPYIATGLNSNKFGVEINAALNLYLEIKDLSNLKIVGVDCHIGSQLTAITPFLAALERVLILVDALQQQGINLQHLDLGGGLGVRYIDESPPKIIDYLAAIKSKLPNNLKLILEPGRSIVAEAGVLLTQVLYLKTNISKNFAIVDAAMNDLIRPALYQAQMPIWQVQAKKIAAFKNYDVVGPICETGDFLAQNYPLNDLQNGDLLAIGGAGAYGFSMASNYNSRPKVAEVLVDGDKCHLIRRRESVTDLFALESLI